jgi:hypothetical protein
MLMMDFVRVCSSADHDHLRAIARDLRRTGITCVLLPSDQAIAVWDIEVSTDDAEAARAIVEGSGVH